MSKIINFVYKENVEPRYKAEANADFRKTSKNSFNEKIFEICTFKTDDINYSHKRQVIDLDKNIASKLVKELIHYFDIDVNSLD